MEEKKGGKGLAIASLVMGILAIVNSFIPFLNIISYIFAILAIIFGIIGIVKKNGLGMAIAGLAMGVLSMILATTINHGTVKVIDDAVNEVKNAYVDINGKTSFKLNESFQNKYEKITVTEINTDFKDYNEFFEPDAGNKVVMVKLEIENVSTENDELYVSSMEFNAYADSVAAESFYGANGSYNSITATVGKGKKAIGYLFYEVPANAQKITVEYNANFWVEGNTVEFIIQ